MDRLEEIRAREQAAISGEWEVVYHNEDYGQGYGEITYFVKMGTTLVKIGIADSADKCKLYETISQFIAHSREDIPYLRGEVERLRAERDAAIKDVSRTCFTCLFEKSDRNASPCSQCCSQCFDLASWKWRGLEKSNERN